MASWWQSGSLSPARPLGSPEEGVMVPTVDRMICSECEKVSENAESGDSHAAWCPIWCLFSALNVVETPKGGSNSVVECQLPKLDVAGSNPVSRSIFPTS